MSNAKASGRNSDWEDHKIIVITKNCSSRVAEAGHSGCGHWSVYIAWFCGFHRVWIRYSTFLDVIQSLDATWDFSLMLLSSCEGLGLCQRSLYLLGPSEFFFLPAWFFQKQRKILCDLCNFSVNKAKNYAILYVISWNHVFQRICALLLQISKCREMRFFANFFLPQKLRSQNFFGKYQVCMLRVDVLHF